MKIQKLETIWFEEQFNTLWLRIHTDEGLIGLGETYLVTVRKQRSGLVEIQDIDVGAII